MKNISWTQKIDTGYFRRIMHLTDTEIHVWTMPLTSMLEREQFFITLLSPDEKNRADRFRFPEHRRRFVIGRAVLRQILSFYTQIAPNKIIFSYGEHKKPALASPLSENLQFNLTHSDELAVYAIAREPVGVDIEAIKIDYAPGLPERFFSPQEVNHLFALPEAARVPAFYQIWARKEAIIKASGKGLVTSLSSFTVSSENIAEKIQLGDEEWYLQPLVVDPAFAAALATQQPAKKLLYYNAIDYLNKL